MRDREAIRVVDDCVRYWRQTGVPPHAVDEMRLELEQHLREAAADGRSVDSVVGPSVSEFAEAWASEQRLGQRQLPSWEEVSTGVVERKRARERELLAYVVGGLVLVAAIATIPLEGGTEDNDVWRWLWTGTAAVLSLGEVVTAGFFLLPFAIGGAAAAVLAWLDLSVLSQWLAFFGGAIVSFAYLQRYVRHQNEQAQPRIGANRWIDSTGLVLERVDPLENVGIVRIGGEEWRATTDGPSLEAGTTIVVVDVRGTRLVVVRQTHVEGREELR